MEFGDYFKGKKITVMGLGLLGRGLGDAKFLAEAGADLIITDLKSAEELATSVAEFTSFSNVQFILGEHRLEDFRDRDFILKAAGVPLDSVFIAEAKKSDIPVKMSASWFAELAGIPVIGITGTRGKSTTTHMLHEIYKAAGKQVLLGGNVRGVSTLSLLKEVTAEHIGIFELDSWQLQGFGEAKMSPHISIFTTFFPDHLNYYHDDLDAYLADKAQIFLYQNEDDVLVLGTQCADLIQSKYAGQIRGQIIVTSDAELPSDWQLQIPGAHNRYDAALALAAARQDGIADEISRSALQSFEGVDGRLKRERTINGVEIFNDTNSTTPDAVLAALDAFESEHKNVILIMGGADKGLDMSRLSKRLSGLKKVVLLSGSGTEKIRTNIPAAPVFDSLGEAVGEALRASEEGDVLLFSPGFASFGMFKNEYDRGDQFLSIVRSL